MKVCLFTTVAAMGLLASSWVLADPYNDTGPASVINEAGTMNNGDSNGLVQGSDAIEGQDTSNNPPLDDNTHSVLDAGVSKDGETLGEED